MGGDGGGFSSVAEQEKAGCVGKLVRQRCVLFAEEQGEIQPRAYKRGRDPIASLFIRLQDFPRRFAKTFFKFIVL